ncbi:MAG: oligosaccharide flippase family protein [Polyangiaceae bacterium]|jgi:O-antigen/teichoic acid export membrane protein
MVSPDLDDALEQPLPPPPGIEPPARRVHSHEASLAVRNGLKLGASLLVTWSLALIVKPRVAAHLGPVKQGYFGFAESFAAMFFTVVGLGIDTYIMKEVSVRPKQASDFVGGVFALRVVTSVALMIVMGIALRITGRPADLQLTVVVFGAVQFLMAMTATLGTILQATGHVGRLALANIGGKIIWGLGLLVGVHFNVPLYVLVLPMFGSELLRAFFLGRAVGSSVELEYRIDIVATKAALIASFPYFVNNMAINFGNNLALSSLEFIRKDDREVGWFAAAQNISFLAMLLHPLLVSIYMPMLARARARSEEEMMSILRRCIEGLLILVAPATIFLSAGAELLLKLMFSNAYAPAHTGVSILSLVFVMVYLNIVLANALVVAGRGWSLTVVSISSIVVMSIGMLVFVPLGRLFLPVGGECAGAAVAVIVSEAWVNMAVLKIFQYAPFDRRNIRVLITILGISIFILILDRYLRFDSIHWKLRTPWSGCCSFDVDRGLGPARLAVDMALYVAFAIGLRLVRFGDVSRAVQLIRARKA